MGKQDTSVFEARCAGVWAWLWDAYRVWQGFWADIARKMRRAIVDARRDLDGTVLGWKVVQWLGMWVTAGVVMSGCARPVDRDKDTLTIGAYSVIREAMQEGLLPAFAARWQQETGRAVRFEQSYNASGAQARAVAAGFDADVVLLSHEGDVDILVKAGLISKDWKEAPYGGTISRSLVVIGVRPGNPLGIRDWGDLTREGVGVLYPDPKTSGGARWNVAAIWGSGLFGPAGVGEKNPQAAFDLLQRVQRNVVNLDPSGRQSMATFRRGTGDAVVTYENELLLERKMIGSTAEYVIPTRTLLIESPAAVVDASVDRHGNRKLAEAFLAFVRGEEGQAILASFGFRSLGEGVTGTGELGQLPEGVFRVKDLGGWSAMAKELFGAGGIWDKLFLEPAAAGGAKR